MKSRVRPLLSVGFQHPFYAGPCGDLECVTPATTADLMRSGRVVGHTAAGRLRLAFEADAAGAPVCTLAGQTLLFGLRLVNPTFENVTEPVLAERGRVPLYRNGADAGALDAPVGIVLTSGIYTQMATAPDRPLTMRLVDAADRVLQTETLAAGRSEVSFDLRSLDDGDYAIDELFQGVEVASKLLCVHRELSGLGPWGLVAIRIADDFYAQPVEFTIPFAVREEPVNYFVVCQNYKDADLDQLSILDEGFGEESRPQITFDRIAPDAPDAGGIGTALLGDSARPVVRFRSTMALKRRERGFRKLRLMRNGQTLVDNLPSAGADRARAYSIVHIAKPS
jgi:hypothetical protein